MRDMIERWGYAGIPLGIALGHAGMPIPEDLVYILAGSLAAQGRLALPLVLLAGVVGVMACDNAGYWIGRRLGRPWARRLAASSSLAERISVAIVRHGALAVFTVRFLPGVRGLGGPLAGLAGIPPGHFLAANGCAAALHVASSVSAGYLLAGPAVLWTLCLALGGGVAAWRLTRFVGRGAPLAPGTADRSGTDGPNPPQSGGAMNAGGA